MKILFLLVAIMSGQLFATVTKLYGGTSWERYSMTAIEADALSSSDSLDISGCHSVTVQAVHASHSDTSTWEIQVSADGTNYDTLTGSSKTTSGASGSGSVSYAVSGFYLAKIKVTEVDGNASATLTPYWICKRLYR